MARMAVWTKEMARALKYEVEPCILLTEQLLSSKQGHYSPLLAVLISVVFKYKCSLQKQVGLFSESHSVGSILHMAFFVPSRKARKWLLVILTTARES